MVQNDRFKHSIFRPFLIGSICIIITLLTLALVMDATFESIQRQKIQDEVLENLSSIDLMIAETSQNWHRLALQIYFDSELQPLALGSRYIGADERTKCLTHLKAYLSTFPYIHSIYFYSKQDNVIYTTDAISVFEKDSFFDVAVIDFIENFSLYGDEQMIPRMIPSVFGNAQTPAYSILCYDRSAKKINEQDIVIINFKYDVIAKYLGKQTYIINRSGLMMGGDSSIAPRTQMKEEAVSQKVLEEIEEKSLTNGSMVFTHAQEHNFVVYARSNIADWVYIRVIPYREIFGPIITIRNTSLIVGIGAMLICILIAVFMALRMARPVENMAKTITQLENEKSLYIQNAQQQYLRTLLHSDMRNRSEEVMQRLAWLEIDVNCDIQYRLFLFVFNGSMGEPEENQVKKILELSLEGEYALQEQGVENIQIDAQQERLVLAVNAAQSSALTDNNYASLKRVLMRVYEKTKCAVCVLIGSDTADLLNLYSLYTQVCSQIDLLFLMDHQAIVDLACQKAPSQDYVFPMKKEESLLKSLRNGDITNALQEYENIVQEAVETFSPLTVRAALQRLAFDIRHLLDTADAGDEENAGKVLCELLPLCRNVSQANRLFEKAFHDSNRQLRSALSEKSSVVIDAALKEIDKNFSNKDLDVAYLAQMVGLSAVYFGKLFRRSTGQTVIEYVQKVRLEHAAQMLGQSSSSVQAISDEVGFSSSSYFSTVFRKKYGLSPNEYRKKCKLE